MILNNAHSVCGKLQTHESLALLPLLSADSLSRLGPPPPPPPPPPAPAPPRPHPETPNFPAAAKEEKSGTLSISAAWGCERWQLSG